ncbi:hypothetical protein EDD15DRAFT_2199423 [Pisolithus albus]|nr:hypothetical protein EDD15DRAFT_2199423 [Pisolithus albus]
MHQRLPLCLLTSPSTFGVVAVKAGSLSMTLRLAASSSWFGHWCHEMSDYVIPSPDHVPGHTETCSEQSAEEVVSFTPIIRESVVPANAVGDVHTPIIRENGVPASAGGERGLCTSRRHRPAGAQ